MNGQTVNTLNARHAKGVNDVMLVTPELDCMEVKGA